MYTLPFKDRCYNSLWESAVFSSQGQFQGVPMTMLCVHMGCCLKMFTNIHQQIPTKHLHNLSYQIMWDGLHCVHFCTLALRVLMHMPMVDGALVSTALMGRLGLHISWIDSQLSTHGGFLLVIGPPQVMPSHENQTSVEAQPLGWH